MSEPYIAQVAIFGFNFAPRDWAFCNGALVPISQNEALFALIGTTYGGNGVNTFALPNIQDRGVVNSGAGPGLSNYVLGEATGSAEVTLAVTQIPAHTHQVSATAGSTQVLVPAANGWFGNEANTGRVFDPPDQIDQSFSSQAISTMGGSLPHPNEQPYLGLNFCIALFGIFPSRN